MSQQMHFDEEERGYQAAYTPTIEEGSGDYSRGYTHMPGQKIGPMYSQGYSQGWRSASSGQRLALAIVSVVVVGGGLFSLNDGMDAPALIARIIGLIVISLVIAMINFAFNWRR
jgi:hypothetical protein